MRVFLFFLLLSHVFSADLEIFIGKKFLNYRAELFSALTKTAADYRLREKEPDGDYAEQLRISFRAAGGIDLSEVTEFIRAALVGQEWIISLYGSYDVKKIGPLLLAAGWEKEKEFFVRQGRILCLTDKIVTVVSGTGMKEFLSTPAAILQMPGADWLRIRKKQLDLSLLFEKAPVLVPFLQGLHELEFYWQGDEAGLNLKMQDSLQAASFVAMASQFMLVVQVVADEMKVQAIKNTSWWQSFDFSTFAAQRNYLTIASGLLGSVSFGSHADVFALKGHPGELDQFFSGNLVNVLNYFLVGGLPFFNSGIKQQLENVFAPAVVDDPDGEQDDGCEVALKMAQQALDFYRQDSGLDVPYEDVENLLFEDGYLPDNLQCSGQRLKGSGLFISDGVGKIILRSQDK